MRKGDNKLFLDLDKLSTMLNLRRCGTAYDTLALYYQCDRTSIEEQCKKYGVYPEIEVLGVRAVVKLFLDDIDKDNLWEVDNGMKYNKGRTYEDYLLKQYPHRKIPSYS